MDWQAFKHKEFAIRATGAVKEAFFEECRAQGILIFMGPREKETRELFVCVQRYEDRFSSGRLELYSIGEWQTRPGMMYGEKGLPIEEFLA